MAHRWADGIRCRRCGCASIQDRTSHKTMPYRCGTSKRQGSGRFSSVKTATFMESSNLGYQEWLFALFLVSTNLKSLSSMQLHRDISVTQRTAWHMVHQIRKALWSGDGNLFEGPVEVYEAYMGRKRCDLSNSKRKEQEGPGPVGKTEEVGMNDRDSDKVTTPVVSDMTSGTLQAFVDRRVVPDTTIYPDESTAYANMRDHDTLKRSVSEYVRGRVHTNGVESFWSTLKRAHRGTFHRLSPKHLHRHVDESAGRHYIDDLFALEQMASIATDTERSQLRSGDLIA